MVFKLVVKSLVICALFVVISSYLVYLQTGKFWLPVLRVPNISVPSFASLQGLVSASLSEADKFSADVNLDNVSAPTYMWLHNGSWHYGDVPPEGMNATRIDGSNSGGDKQ